MKKSFKIYSLIWAICIAVFNVITFVTPNEIGGVSKFSGSFWVGYIFMPNLPKKRQMRLLKWLREEIRSVNC